MIINIKKGIHSFFIVVFPWMVLAFFLIGVGQILRRHSYPYVMGAFIHTEIQQSLENEEEFMKKKIAFDRERFQRPSKEKVFPLSYEFKLDSKSPYIASGYPRMYDNPQQLIEAYFSILKESSNFKNVSGGCGSIGLGDIPYPYAYYLLSRDTKKSIALESFKSSFEDIGHITLLKLIPAYESPSTPQNIKSYIVEIETITGTPKKESSSSSATLFAYYYGIVTTEHTTTDGWKIVSVSYYPEDFLCAPYHHWAWESQSFVSIIYGDWYKLIDKIEKVQKEQDIITVYAKGKSGQYKFEFLRLTNGEDILIHEYTKENNQWKEVHLLKKEHENFKLFKNKI